MQMRLNPLVGGPVLALDGEVGTIRDFYFDDEMWTVRYMVVDTGAWLPGRQVLLSMWALHAPDWEQRRVPVRLTREQIRKSPDVSTQRPVSRSNEAKSLGYYGYPPYWGGPALWGPVPAPALGTLPPPPPFPVHQIEESDEENHLRSCREVTGYHLRASDGEIGHVDDLLIDAHTWRIEHLLVDTSNLIGGRHVAVPAANVESIAWAEGLVHVTLSKDAVANSPAPELHRG
jgi:uncharacterized protein YrrD